LEVLVTPGAAASFSQDPPTSDEGTRVLLVECHKMLARLLTEVLAQAPEFRVVAVAERGHLAAAVAGATQPGLVVIDQQLSDLGGLEVVSTLRAAGCTARIILLIEQEDPRYRQAAWQRGASACLAKERIASDLVATSRSLFGQDDVRLA
jgi:two-component system nitrate/nitrite response regulator NarL